MFFNNSLSKLFVKLIVIRTKSIRFTDKFDFIILATHKKTFFIECDTREKITWKKNGSQVFFIGALWTFFIYLQCLHTFPLRHFHFASNVLTCFGRFYYFESSNKVYFAWYDKSDNLSLPHLLRTFHKMLSVRCITNV